MNIAEVIDLKRVSDEFFGAMIDFHKKLEEVLSKKETNLTERLRKIPKLDLVEFANRYSFKLN